MRFRVWGLGSRALELIRFQVFGLDTVDDINPAVPHNKEHTTVPIVLGPEANAGFIPSAAWHHACRPKKGHETGSSLWFLGEAGLGFGLWTCMNDGSSVPNALATAVVAWIVEARVLAWGSAVVASFFVWILPFRVCVS